MCDVLIPPPPSSFLAASFQFDCFVLCAIVRIPAIVVRRLLTLSGCVSHCHHHSSINHLPQLLQHLWSPVFCLGGGDVGDVGALCDVTASSWKNQVRLEDSDLTADKLCLLIVAITATRRSRHRRLLGGFPLLADR